MKCQILFIGKNKKNISKCRLLKILPRVLSVKAIVDAAQWKINDKWQTTDMDSPQQLTLSISCSGELKISSVYCLLNQPSPENDKGYLAFIFSRENITAFHVNCQLGR